LVTEKLQDTEGLGAQHDGRGEGPVQSLPGRDGGAREVVVGGDVGNPGRPATGPDAAGQADALREGLLASGRLERRQLRGGAAPHTGAAENLGLPVHGPDSARVPAETLADRPEQLR